MGVEDMMDYLDRQSIARRAGYPISVKEAWKAHQIKRWMAAYLPINRHACWCEDCCELREASRQVPG